MKADLREPRPGHNTYWFPPGGTIGLFLNLTKAPYSNVNFRQGISLALNRATIAQKAVNGYIGAGQPVRADPAEPAEVARPEPAQPGHGEPEHSGRHVRVRQGRYTTKGGKLVGPNGKQATMTIVLPNSFTDWVAAATEISTELRAVGHQGHPRPAAVRAVRAGRSQAGTFDAAIGGFGGTGIPYTDFNNGAEQQLTRPR